jgi:hypothetical protein
MIAQQKEQTQQQSMKTQTHATTVNNAVLARLMNEVRVEKNIWNVGDRFDRCHNRHNR